MKYKLPNIEVNKIPVMKKPNSTAGPDFFEENNIPLSEAQLAAIKIGSGDKIIKGTNK